MRTESPAILVVSTHARTLISRLAFRFWKYGCRVSGVCPPDNELRLAMHIDHCYSFRANDPLGSLRRAIEQSGAGYVLPGDDLAYSLVRQLALREEHCRSLVERSMGAASSFETLRSRFKALELAQQMGITISPTVPFRSLREIQESELGGKFPLVLKRDGTSWGRGVETVEDDSALVAKGTRLMAQSSFALKMRLLLLAGDPMGFVESYGLHGAGFCAQAMISGIPATALFACWQGRVLGDLQARVLASQGLTRPPLLIRLMDDERISQAGERLAARLGLSGYLGLDFVLSEASDEPYLTDVNPRCTQLGHIQRAGEPDLAGLLWAAWTGRPAPEAGEEGLGNVVSFYPFMPEGDGGRRLYGRPRWDITGDDLLVDYRVQRERKGLLARLRRMAKQAARGRLKAALPSSQIHYFKNSG